MAKRKAIFGGYGDFKLPLDVSGLKINPYKYYNGVDLPTDVPFKTTSHSNRIAWIGGEPTIVEGVRGNAAKFNGNALIWNNWHYPEQTRFSLSMWVKVPAQDLTGWKILATNRGDGWGDNGIHLALYNGQLNIRAYGEGGSVSAYSVDSGQIGKTIQADTWYNITVVFFPSASNNLQVIVNGERWIQTFVAFRFLERTYSFMLGDMLAAGQIIQYPFHGIIDEVIYAYNENAWSVSDAIRYYTATKNGEYLDDRTSNDSLQLAKGMSGKYPTAAISWETPIVDLGGEGKFNDYGRLSASGYVGQGTSSLDFYTRTSSDKESWNEWVAVESDGKIVSENLRYLQIRVDFKSYDGLDTPVLHRLEVFEEVLPPPVIELPDKKIQGNAPLYLYKDLSSGLDSLGVLRNAYDIIIEEVVNGEESLTFKLPIKDKKRKEIGSEPVEMIAMISDRYFTVKEIIDKRDDSGKLFSEFVCEAIWTELRDWYVADFEVVESSARFALETLFSNVFREAGDPEFDWKIGNVELGNKKRTARTEWSDVLSMIRAIQDTWGGEVLFDTETKTVHLLSRIGKDSGVRFYYEKNMKNIERQIDTYDLITRIYPTGKGGLDITTVNNGVPYLENKTWVDKLNLRRKVIPFRWKDERYTIPNNLKEDGQKMLDELSKPAVRYSTTVHDLSKLSGHEHEAFELGDTVTAIDNELFGEVIENRVVRRKLDVRRPENTEIELSQPMKTLADVKSRALDDSISNLIESDPLSTSDVQQMTVFNQLLNSRVDDGFNSWVHEANGTQFDVANAGFSGSWSFKVKPDYNQAAQLTQTVEGVSHRSTYTISAAVATEGQITRGSSQDAFVGIKVLVYYEDQEEPEAHYLGIPDSTSTDEEEVIEDDEGGGIL